MALDDQYGSIVMRKYSRKARRLFVNYSLYQTSSKKEKVITKFLIYSFTIKINQINVFFFCNDYN